MSDSPSTLRYIAKYASKAESQAPAFPELLSGVTNTMDAGGTAQSACQKLLNKMLGERTYSAQEMAHLLLGIPLVRSSSSFHTLSIGSDGGHRELGEQDPDGSIPEGDDIEEGARRVTGASWLQRSVSQIVMTIEKLISF